MTGIEPYRADLSTNIWAWLVGMAALFAVVHVLKNWWDRLTAPYPLAR